MCENMFSTQKLLVTLLLILPFIVLGQSSDKLVNLGPQVTDKHLEGSIFLEDSKGKEWLYTVVRGNPGYLLGYDLADNSLVVNLPLIKMDGAWDIAVASDGWLYIAGSAGGRLAKHWPGTQEIIDLGKPLDSETYLFALAPGRDGEIFGATFPNCKVFRYHPSVGFSDVGKGPIKKGEQYVHALAYHESTDKLYAGIGSRSYIVELDPRTGNGIEILPTEYQGSAGHIYDMKIVKGLLGGDRLFANSNDLGKTFIYNIKTKEFENEIPRSISVKSVIGSLQNDKVYFSAGWDNMYSYGITEERAKPVLLGKTNKILASRWKSKEELMILNTEAKLLNYNVESNKSKEMSMEVPAQPIGLIAVHTGPKNKIWTGGYLVGGNAVYDGQTNATVEYSGLNQAEGITVSGDNIYFGTYSRAEFYVYDTKKPWDKQSKNPKKIGQAAGQDRPFGGVAARELNKMFFGTVPGYGKLGGVLAEYDEVGDKMNYHTDVVKDLSIVSLAYKDGLVFGGTSIWGGLGVAPTCKEAVLFVWDTSTKNKVHEFVPVPDAKAITELIVGPDGNIWGVADGTLFIYDLRQKKLVYSKIIYPVTAETKSKAVWRDARLLQHPSGVIYGTGGGNLFSIDPKTKTTTILPLDIRVFDIAMDNEGRLYFRNGKNLWQYKI